MAKLCFVILSLLIFVQILKNNAHPTTSPTSTGTIATSATTEATKSDKLALKDVKKAEDEGFKVVCYYESWSVYRKEGAGVKPEDLNTDICTHINYAFVNVNSDGTLTPTDNNLDIAQGGYEKTTGLKKRNGKLKVLLSIGGAATPPETFANIAKDPAKRSAMVKSAREYMEKYKFDGADLDWELPLKNDKENFISLLEEFKKEFDQHKWLLTAAVSASPGEGYDVGKMSNLLTFINVMTYDFYGPWSKYTGQNSPLHASSVESDWEKKNLNLAAGIDNWLNAGAPAGKLIAGIAFYGRTFTLQDKNNNKVHAPISGPGNGGPILGAKGVWTYLEILKAKGSWNCHWDDEQKVPVCINGDQWMGSDDPRSVKEKMDFIKQKKLGGAMVWAVDQDDVHGEAGNAWPLLNVIGQNK